MNAKRSVWAGALGVAALSLGPVAIPLLGIQKPDAPAATPAALERGRYLTHSVAMCVQCHSPRDDQGAIIVGREFEERGN